MGGSWQVDVLSDRVSGNTQLLGDAPQGDTLQPGVVDSFPQGLLARRCLLGWRSVRGGGRFSSSIGCSNGCFQSGQALQLQLGETMPAQGLRFLTTRGQFGSRSQCPLGGPQRSRLGRSFLVGDHFPLVLHHELSVALLQHLHLDTGIAGPVPGLEAAAGCANRYLTVLSLATWRRCLKQRIRSRCREEAKER